MALGRCVRRDNGLSSVCCPQFFGGWVRRALEAFGLRCEPATVVLSACRHLAGGDADSARPARIRPINKYFEVEYNKYFEVNNNNNSNSQ